MFTQQLKTRNQEMAIEIESLFTTALGLSAPWRVEKVKLDMALRRIDFDLACDARRLTCTVCGLADQGIHDRQGRDLEKKRRLFACQDKDNQAHGGKPEQIAHVCQNTNEVRRNETSTQPQSIKAALGDSDRKLLGNWGLTGHEATQRQHVESAVRGISAPQEEILRATLLGERIFLCHGWTDDR